MFELTNRDLEDLADLLDVGFGEITTALDQSRRTPSIATWIVGRREDPGLTFEQARDMPLTQAQAHLKTFMAALAGDDADEPKVKDGDPKASKRVSSGSVAESAANDD
jgi:hypothetical protein